MTTLTPEELAACREAYCKEYGYDPEWDVVIDEDFQKAFSAGLFHKQAESAKEIADLQQHIDTDIDFIRQYQREIAALKAQVEGLRKLLTTAENALYMVTNCDALIPKLNKEHSDDAEHEEARIEHVLNIAIDAHKAIEQEKPNDR